jgi:hypothetical protein
MECFGICWRHVVRRNGAHCVALMEKQRTEFGVEEPHGIRQNGLKRRHQLAGRARYDLQHLGCRGLLLSRLR